MGGQCLCCASERERGVADVGQYVLSQESLERERWRPLFRKQKGSLRVTASRIQSFLTLVKPSVGL